ncbi:MAG: aromatic hydrocarbon degradation protein, partial [Ferruginibacter sp.]
MKKNILFIFSLFISLFSFSQTPEDALRYSWLTHSGTARYMAIGGTMGSLGGDVSAAYVNPAGLGFFRTGELVFTPALVNNKETIKYRGNQLSPTKKNA